MRPISCGIISMAILSQLLLGIGCGTVQQAPTEDSTQLVSSVFLSDEQANGEASPQAAIVRQKSTPATSQASLVELPPATEAQNLISRQAPLIVKRFFPDPYTRLQVRILNHAEKNGQQGYECAITWSDKWSKSPYELRGILWIDGQQAVYRYELTSKNAAAEALEPIYGAGPRQFTLQTPTR